MSAVRRRLELIGLDAVMALAAINLWTGAPVLAVWVGSRFSNSTSPTMGAVAIVAVTLLALSLALIHVLGLASAAHDRLLGQEQTVRRHVPWLRSMRAERVSYERGRASLTTLDRLLVVTVVLAVLGFEVWFFVADPSPLSPGPSKDY